MFLPLLVLFIIFVDSDCYLVSFHFSLIFFSIPVCDESLFSFCFQDSLFVFFAIFFFDSLTTMCVEVHLIYTSWILLRFLNVQISVFHQIWDVFSCYFFRYSLSLLLGYTFCWYTWWYPTGLWISVPLSSSLFFFCSSNWININWPI